VAGPKFIASKMADAQHIPKAGHVKLVLYKAILKSNTQCCGRMDPYIRFTLGKTILKSPVCASGHQTPEWHAHPKFFFELGAHKDVKYDTLSIEVFNSRLFKDDLLATNYLPVAGIVSNVDNISTEAPPPIFLGMPQKFTDYAGELYASLSYVPPLTVTIHEAANIQDVQIIGKQDPYCLLEMQGCIAPGSDGNRRTRTHNDGDRAPKWNEKFDFNILDRTELEHTLHKPLNTSTSVREEKKQEPGLWIQVVDENVLVDKSIGYCFISLLQLLETRKEGKPIWFKLYEGKKEEGGKVDSGSISVSVA